MNELIASFQKDLGPDLKRLERLGRYYKMCFLLTILMGTLIASIKISNTRMAHMSLEELLPYFLLGYAIIAIPLFLQSPLNFLPDKYLTEINLGLKRKIIYHEIEKYKANLALHTDSSLPDELLFDIGLLSDTFRFGFGDNYLLGTFNGLKTEISQFHVRNLFYSLFNGFVAEIHLPGTIGPDETLTRPSFSEKFKSLPDTEANSRMGLILQEWMKTEELLMFVALRGRTLYIGVKGERKMFESTYSRLVKDSSSLVSDIASLSAILHLLDKASTEFHIIENPTR